MERNSTSSIDHHSTYTPASQKLVNSSAMDLLLIEVVPLAQSVVQQLKGIDNENSISSASSENNGHKINDKKHNSSTGGDDAQIKSDDVDLENDDDVYYRVEGYGYRVGKGLAEMFTRDRARFADKNTDLDIMKFICKEVWTILYKKQMDNLKTNHRGTFVLIDNNFKYCQRMSTENSQETLRRATPHLWFPVGILRGVLAALGVAAEVSFDTQQLPSIAFNIQTAKSSE